MLKNTLVLVILLISLVLSAQQTRRVLTLEEDWKFYKGEATNAETSDFDDARWQTVSVPHDWAIYGPFDKEIDKQTVAITQNGETIPTEKTGRTGALPFTGTGWYRKNFNIEAADLNKKVLLLFEGAMSEPEVYLNGKKIGEWAYGYAYFYFNISDALLEGQNTLAVKLSNAEFSSRWYPGAGLYRPVSLIIKDPASIDQWGTTITTPVVTQEVAKVNIKTNFSGKNLSLKTTIYDAQNLVVAQQQTPVSYDQQFDQNLKVVKPSLWSPENPYLYKAVTQLYSGDELKDEVATKFGIRSINYSAENGFQLNGETRKFKGVCLHHDLGPLGTAVNKAALRRQMQILKDLGCNAIRSAHNMPSFEQLELADEMGFLFLAESFDEWKKPKVKNGYNRFFDDYAEKDVVNLVRATRNHPSIVMWSAGNEVPDQYGSAGVKRALWLQNIFHREDPTRPVTVGMDQVKATMESGFGAILDIPGLNYVKNEV